MGFSFRLMQSPVNDFVTYPISNQYLSGLQFGLRPVGLSVTLINCCHFRRQLYCKLSEQKMKSCLDLVI